jgi:hypothetical protein
VVGLGRDEAGPWAEVTGVGEACAVGRSSLQRGGGYLLRIGVGMQRCPSGQRFTMN